MKRATQQQIAEELELVFIDTDTIIESINVENEKQWLEEFYLQVIKKLEFIDEYCSVAASVVKYLNDQGWAKGIYKHAAGEAEDAGDYSNLAESIFEVLADKSWALELLKQAVEVSEDSEDYYFSAATALKLNDKPWAVKLYKTAVDQAEDYDDYCSIAKSIITSLDDKTWATKLYKQALGVTEDSDDACQIAIEVFEVLADKVWAKSIIKQQLEDRNNIALRYQELTETIIYLFDDRKWVKSILTETHKMFETSMAAAHAITITIDDDELECTPRGGKLFFDLAETVVELLDDYQWAMKIVHEALATAQTIADYCAAGTVAKNHLKAIALAVDFYKIGYDKITTINELIYFTEAVCEGLGDQYWGRELVHEAIAKCEATLEYCRIAEVVASSSGLDDKKWADEILKTALECAKSDLERETVDKFIAMLEEDEIPF